MFLLSTARGLAISDISLTECNSGTIQKKKKNCPFAVNTTIQLKYTTQLHPTVMASSGLCFD